LSTPPRMHKRSRDAPSKPRTKHLDCRCIAFNCSCTAEDLSAVSILWRSRALIGAHAHGLKGHLPPSCGKSLEGNRGTPPVGIHIWNATWLEAPQSVSSSCRSPSPFRSLQTSVIWEQEEAIKKELSRPQTLSLRRRFATCSFPIRTFAPATASYTAGYRAIFVRNANHALAPKYKVHTDGMNKNTNMRSV